jgi:uncharacterized protein YkwD
MKRFFCGSISLLILLIMAPAGAGEELSSVGSRERERATHLHTEFDFKSFRQQPRASREIDFDQIDIPLLAAAVFHETNRRRSEQNLPALRYRREAQEAAEIQAQGMAQANRVAHEHPDQALRDLADRVAHVGLRPAFAAENVAMTFGIQYQSGRPVYPRQQQASTVFSYSPDGPAIKAHTYLSYAESLVDQWMDSPGHRKNILHKTPEEMGTGHVHGINDIGMDVFYSVQVFFKPLERRPGRK